MMRRFNLSPLILYPLWAIIAVSEDDTCEFDKNRCMRKQNFRPFFILVFFYIPIFMIGKNIGAAAAPLPPLFGRPCNFTQFFKVCHVDVMWTIYAVRWSTNAACNTDAGLRC